MAIAYFKFINAPPGGMHPGNYFDSALEKYSKKHQLGSNNYHYGIDLLSKFLAKYPEMQLLMGHSSISFDKGQ